MRRLIPAALSALLALAMLPVWAADLWYEDNTLGKQSLPSDFIEKFRRPEAWSEASGYIRVYMVRAKVLNDRDDQFYTTLFMPFLKKHNIQLAFDAGGATWAQLPNRDKVTAMELALLKRLKGLGVEVGYISLQSVLSKPHKGDAYPMSKRVEDVVSFSKAARAIYPNAVIGIIDALPSHGEEYREPYKMARDALAREKIPLGYVHLDISFDGPRLGRKGLDWNAIVEVENYVERDLGAQFGLFAKSRKGGMTSSKDFHMRTIATLDCYSGSGGTPAAYIITSFFPHPEKTIPESATGDDYPAMRTVRDFGREMKTIEQAGKGRQAQQSSNQRWRSQCGVNPGR